MNILAWTVLTASVLLLVIATAATLFVIGYYDGKAGPRDE